MQATKLQPDQQKIMQGWASRLQQWRMHQLAAALLEASGPLKLVGAQLVYLGQPVLGGFVANEQLNTLAEMLEEPSRAKTFIRYLREEVQ
ncbi:MAG TPA: hypothetical protein DCY42_12865 [Chloroflexi bacterium]|nr:hypothetical protein [Chloroflexota bacterium]